MNDPLDPCRRPSVVDVWSMNLRFGLAHDDGVHSWANRKSGLGRLLETYRADFLAFQEANDFQTDYLSTLLQGYGMIGKRCPAPPFWQNNITFYRDGWRCLHQEHFFLSPTPSIPSRFRDSRWPRQCTLGLFQRQRHHLIFVNTHFDFDAGVRVASARIIMDRLRRLAADWPAILVGDFNAPPRSPCHAVFTGAEAETGTNTAAEFFKNAFREPFPGTYHGFTGRPIGDHIDWILYRGRIIPRASRVVDEAVDGVYPSDHFPLYASFDLPD